MRMTLLATVALCACAAPVRPTCNPGATCDLRGHLTILPGQPAWVAVLQSGPSCYKLALPSEFYRHVESWNGKEVSVVGEGFDQFADDSTIWVEHRGRRMSMGVCDHGTAIYVTRLSGPAGTLRWPMGGPEH